MAIKWPRRRARAVAQVAPGFDLDLPLLQLSRSDIWTIRDACQGTQIFGATGSGKTSGSGQAIAKAFLNAGFGGLVLTAKPDETALWQRYAAETDRSESLLVFGPGRSFAFNFLDYELRRPGVGAGLTGNLVNLFCDVIEVAGRGRSAGQGGSNEAFWTNALKQLLRNAIDLVVLAGGRLTLGDVADIILSAPQWPEEARDAQWQEHSRCFELLEIVDARQPELTQDQQYDASQVARYWMMEFPGLAEKTRSIIVNSFTAMADCFLRAPLRSLFCDETTIVPEMTLEGAVIVLDLPVKEYDEVGRFAQVLFKLLWQRAVERRDTNANPRPVFLWADEAQNFITSSDQQFQTTARSARACTVYLTQNLPNYYHGLSDGGQHAVDSLLGNLQTKIFHANGDAVTNEWAERLFSKRWTYRSSMSSNQGERVPDREGRGGRGGGSQQQGISTSQSLDAEVLAREFTQLRSGGPHHGWGVDAIVFEGGRVWGATGRNWLKTTFDQRGG